MTEQPESDNDTYAGVLVGLIDGTPNVYLRLISEDGEHYSQVEMLPNFAKALGRSLIVAATRYN